MSIYIKGFTEAKTDGKWRCIDFFQEKADGSMQYVNCISGCSTEKHILDWNCNPYALNCPPDDLSEGVRTACTSRTGVLCGTDPSKDGCYWYEISGYWFKNADLSIPEYCGFFPRQKLGDYLRNPEENNLDTDSVLSVEEYRKLPPEEKQAYQYYEYDEPFGELQTLRRFKDAVQSRIEAYNRDMPEERMISFSDIRVLILES